MMTEKQLIAKFHEYVNNEEYATLQDVESDQEEYNYNDTVLVDVSLESIIDGLLYNGMSIKELHEMLKAHYGNVIHVYYLKEDEMYAVLVGAR